VSPRVSGIAGVALGVLATFVAVPPIEARSIVWPIVVGGIGAALGLWTALRGPRRLGWSAFAAGLIGIGLGILATHSSEANLETVFRADLIASMFVFSTPLVFAGIGGMFSERSGVVNIGLEGMMLTGAFFAIWGADRTHSWIGGLVIAMAAGGLLALIYAYFAIQLRADQIVGGTAINFLALGITGYLYIDVYGVKGTPNDLPGIPDVHISWLHKIPPQGLGRFLQDSFGQMNLMIWMSLLLLVVTWLLMFKTPLGLRIRAVGEHPRAADTVGISVYRVRYGSVTLSGVLAALGGAYLTLGFVHSFSENITAGRGFIALAALIFGGWRPFGAYGATLLFGFSSALAIRLPDAYGPSAGTLFSALPYVLTLIAVAGVIGRSIPPAAVGRPYKKQ
jgi:ABC-type uncharacterized transport system permease subunit